MAGSNASRLQSLPQEGSLLFITEFLEIPGTVLNELGRVKKAELTLELPSGF